MAPRTAGELSTRDRLAELVPEARNDKLHIEREYADPKDRAQYIRNVLRALGQPAGPIR